MLTATATTEIVGAFVGVVGALIGVAGYLSGKRKDTQAEDDRRELKRQQERVQAGKVNGWAERRTEKGRVVVAQNSSDQPVRKVKIWLVTPRMRVPQGEVPDRDPAARREVLAPNDSLEYCIPIPRGEPALAKRPGVVLTFIDNEGRGWLRNVDGRLTRRNA